MHRGKASHPVGQNLSLGDKFSPLGDVYARHPVVVLTDALTQLTPQDSSWNYFAVYWS